MFALDFLLLRSPLQSYSLAFQDSASDLNPMFVEGLRLAAPDFYKELQKIDFANEKQKQKIQDSFYKYWLRSCTRCTPYGIFAGSTVVNIKKEQTSIVIRESKDHILKSRLDMGLLFLLKNKIEEIPEILSQLKFSVNDSLYETASDLRYAEYSIQHKIRNYKLSSIEKTGYITFICSYAKTPKTIAELNEALAKFSGIEVAEVESFIKEIRDSQILVSELELNLTGIDPLQHLIENLEGFIGIEAILDKLKHINLLLQSAENQLHFNEIERELLEGFQLEDQPKDIIQVDLKLGISKNVIDKVVVDELVKQSEDLFLLSRMAANPAIEVFKRKFLEKYEGQEIPITIALDNDLGIGYGDGAMTGGSEWIDDLPIGMLNSGAGHSFDELSKFTFLKYQDFLTNGNEAIDISQEELAALKNVNQHHKFPSSLYIFGSLLRDDKSAHPGAFKFGLNGIGGPSAANLIGRFTLGDEELTGLAQDVLSREEAEYPNAIFAEIVHTPEGRVGNILLRSHLRKYEIPYLGKSGLNEESQIPVNDIMVSVKGNEIVLRSIKHHKRIFPRLSTAHNFQHQSLPMYKFLCDLQLQGYAYPNVWDWGVLNNLKYLPRVTYKSLILKKARWVIDEIEVTALSAEPNNFDRAFEQLREKRKLPKMVVVVQSDNHLLMDLENDQSIRIFLSYVKKYKSIVLEEFLFTAENCIVRDVNNQPFTNEVIIPVHRKNVEQVLKLKNEVGKIIQRKFPPGSEWMYLKVYGGNKSLEKILMNDIYLLLQDSLENRCFEKFFFVRYQDQADHLRLRFYNSKTEKHVALQNKLMMLLSPYLESGQLDKVSIDTYVREIERYSEQLMEESESIFFNDSMAVLRLNTLINEIEEPLKYKLLFAMRGIDVFFMDFGMSLADKVLLLKRLSDGYMQEFGAAAQLKQDLNHKYRKIQQEIFSHMDDFQDDKNEIQEAINIFKLRTELNAEPIRHIQSKLGIEKKDVLLNLLADYIHMFNNRLFIAQQRKYELVVYAFLERYYSSILAIQSKKTNKMHV